MSRHTAHDVLNLVIVVGLLLIALAAIALPGKLDPQRAVDVIAGGLLGFIGRSIAQSGTPTPTDDKE
jgi:hypothetical protein